MPLFPPNESLKCDILVFLLYRHGLGDLLAFVNDPLEAIYKLDIHTITLSLPS